MDGRDTFFSEEFKGAEECKSEVSEGDVLRDAILDLQERFKIAEASYAKHHGSYDYIVFVLFKDNSARYEGLQEQLRNRFIQHFGRSCLIQVVHQNDFENSRDDADAPIPVIQCLEANEMEGLNQFSGCKPT